MKFDFSFEALIQQALSPALLEKVGQDQDYLNKVAASGSTMQILKGILPHMGVALGAAAITGTAGYLTAKNKYQAHEEGLKSSFSNLLGAHKDFSQQPIEFQQRFSELALISPTVASNPRLAQKIIQPRLKKGFDLDDVHRLAAIEYHTGHSPKIQDPTAAAKAQALMTFGDWAKFVYPYIVAQRVAPQIAHEVKDVVRNQALLSDKDRKEKEDRVQSTLERIQGRQSTMEGILSDPTKAKAFSKFTESLKKSSGGDMPKTSSENLELLVSEECMGRMLADRYCMHKTAAPLFGKTSFLGQAWNKGGAAMGDYLKVMALPLAIGGGIKLVQDLMKHRGNEKMKSEADRIFAGMKKNNEYVKDSPELAQEAFDTLRSFAPSLAAKPIIARTFVEHVVKSNGVLPPDTANTLAKTEQLIQQLNDATGGGFIEGLKNPMSLFKHTISKGKSSKDE